MTASHVEDGNLCDVTKIRIKIELNFLSCENSGCHAVNVQDSCLLRCYPVYQVIQCILMR
jgi:hypothetical protein